MFPNNAIFFVELIVILICTPLNGQFSNPNLRIVGGSFSQEGEAPFQVSLQYENKHFCGGSILNKCWVLTAAHCFIDVHADDLPYMSVLAGTTNLVSGYGTKVKMEKIINHANYTHLINKQLTNLNDIALVKLKTCLEYSSTIQPVQLQSDYISGGVNVAISGWGRTDQNNSQSTNNLKVLPVTTITNQKCKESFPFLDAGKLCVFRGIGTGACVGDSGGPLMMQGTNVQVGLVSFGLVCARGVPDCFTRISSYIQWIVNHAK